MSLYRQSVTVIVRKSLITNDKFSDNPLTLTLHFAPHRQLPPVSDQLRPDFVPALNNLGAALKDSHRVTEVIHCHQQALRLAPNSPETYNNLGNAHRADGQLHAAIACYQNALRLGSEDGRTRLNLANTLREAGQLAEAIGEFRHVLEVNPEFAEAHWDLSFALLLSGKFLEGWREYEWRWQRSDLPFPKREFTQPSWEGDALQGRRILIHILKHCSLFATLPSSPAKADA